MKNFIWLFVVILAISPAHAQRTGFLERLVNDAKKELIDTIVKDTTVEALGGDSQARTVYELEWWNDHEFIPRTLTADGLTYKHVRMGVSNKTNMGSGWLGRSNCDDWYLASAMANAALTEDRIHTCDKIEHQIIQKNMEHDGTYHATDGLEPWEIRENRIKWFKTEPHRFYARHDFQMRRRAGGAIIFIPSKWITGHLTGANIHLSGPQVSTYVLDPGLGYKDILVENSSGKVIQLFVSMTQEEIDRIMPKGMKDLRSDAYDTIYWTINSVSKDHNAFYPTYNFTITIDRLELGMGALDAPPSRYVVWRNGDALKD